MKGGREMNLREKFTLDDTKMVLDNLKRLEELEQEFEGAEECGVDCSEYRNTVENLKQGLINFLRHYLPTTPDMKVPL